MFNRVLLNALTVLFICGFVLSQRLQGDDSAQSIFRDRVEPILRERCFGCHSHAAGELQGGLALDWRTGWESGGQRGPAIIPGKPEQSLLLQAIMRTDPELQMPPDDPMSAEEIEALEQWIELGAFDDRKMQSTGTGHEDPTDWWSLRRLEQPSVPEDGYDHPIDAFVRQRLRREGVKAAPEADRPALIRRVTYDLTGLPPTPEEVRAFVNDPDPLAFENLVDRLLESPRYGERWARHWLDTVHFADSHGFEHDVARDSAWRYRDYVIESLNGDTPWPRFIREQIAADVLYPESSDLIAALGFLGAGPFDLSAFSTAPVSFAYTDRDDLVTQTMAAFVSTTANCARCHAHKFDPVSQEDYYALQAVFAGLTKGNIVYDADPSVQVERRHLQSLLDAAERRDATILLSSEAESILAQGIIRIEESAPWVTFDVDAFLSSEGTQLSRIDDGVFLAGGDAPETDDYTIVATNSLETISAIRLEVLTHDSLPQQGPGRATNGNLHLTDFVVQLFEGGAKAPRSVAITNATADFNQVDWGIDKAIDDDPDSAWGIHPEEGRSHQAVFELAEPLAMEPGAKLAIVMKQRHGRQHVIGSFRLSATSVDPSRALAIPAEVLTALKVPAEQRSESQTIAIAAFAVRLQAEEKLKSLPEQAVVYAAGKEVVMPTGNGATQVQSLGQPQTVHVLERGDFSKPLDVAQPGALSILTHLPARFEIADATDEGRRRAALADWLSHRDNVLTWRSVVNRVWHYHFGRGLCDTPSDLGRMGGLPSHPGLLDWLAVWFRDDAKGSLKALHRLILTSATWRQSSQHDDPHAVAIDSENRLLWRRERQRLDADAYRDFTMAVAGTLDFKMGGPGVRHFAESRGPQSTPTLDYDAYDWSGPGAGRRSIYRFVWRGIPDPFMEMLDFPELGLLAPTRSVSTSSLQALSMYNNDFVLHHADALARRVIRETKDNESQVRRIVQLVWCREATSDELRRFVEFAQRYELASLCRVLLNSNEYLFVN